MAITIKDIAKQAGVSHSTVSRALRGSPLISKGTSERVRKIAAEMGYSPSVAARSLKTNRSQALGVIVSNIDDPFFSEILQGIEEVAQTKRYSLFMAASQRDPERERIIVQAMHERRVDGVIICSTPFSTEQNRQFLKYEIPIVVINNQAAEDYRYSIYHDDVDGSRQITSHLIKLGHEKIAFLGNALSGRTTLDRLSGFQQELKGSGITIPETYIHQVSGGKPQNGLRGLEYFLDMSDRPTALVCFNDLMAIGVLKGLHQADIKVPEMLSVTGFDNIEFSAYTNPPLTTFDQPKRFIGAEAARLVLGMLDNSSDKKPTSPTIHTLKGKLLIRKSTAPPSKTRNWHGS